MTSSADASTSTTKPNPMQDDDLSELTKKEILFWARKLKLSPSELFTLSKEDLERYLERVQQEEFYDEQRKNQYEKWERLSEMKRFLLEEQHRERLRGGGMPSRRTVWDILCAAASEIESMYGESQETSGNYSGKYPCSNSSGPSYESSSLGGFRTPPVPNMCSTIYEMHPDDSQYTPPDFPSTLSATPISYSSYQRRNSIPMNATYDVSATKNTCRGCVPRNATFDLQRRDAPNRIHNACPLRNATFDMPRAANATYNIGPPMNATYNVSQNPNATYDVCRQAPNTTYNLGRQAPNATYNVCLPVTNTTYDVCRQAPNATYNVCPPAPNATYDIGRQAPNTTYSLPRSSANVTSKMPQMGAPNAASARNRTFNALTQRGRGNVTFDVSSRCRSASPSFRPNPVMTSTPKNCPRTGQKPYFRNYTDYWLTLSGRGISEASQSVTYDVFSDNKSMIRAAARTYSLPHRSKSCPPIGRPNSASYHVNSGSIIPCPRGGSRGRSPMHCPSPVQAITAASCGISPLARPARDRSYSGPRRLCQGKMGGFCDCARRSRSLARC